MVVRGSEQNKQVVLVRDSSGNGKGAAAATAIHIESEGAVMERTGIGSGRDGTAIRNRLQTPEFISFLQKLYDFFQIESNAFQRQPPSLRQSRIAIAFNLASI